MHPGGDPACGCMGLKPMAWGKCLCPHLCMAQSQAALVSRAVDFGERLAPVILGFCFRPVVLPFHRDTRDAKKQ